MKKLTKIKLINWHYFVNQTIEVKNNILLTGQNASGKSTILDAITFLITAGEQTFNLAANEKGKRDLKGYVKCKLGQDDREYLRNGDVTGHIALEFYEEKYNRYFTIGAVIDCFGDLLPPKVLFYVKEDKISDEMFLDDENHILSTVLFKKYDRADEFVLTKKEAKRIFRNRFGSINEKYFSMIPKALAFKPIGDVKQFIYQNILEEKYIDVDSIQDAIRSYKELELTLQAIKRKINDLNLIKTDYEELKKYKNQEEVYRYILNLLDKNKIQKQIFDLKISNKRLEDDLNEKGNSIVKLEDEIESLNERSKEIYAQLSSNQEFQSNEYYEKQVTKYKQQLQVFEGRLKVFIDDLQEYSRIGKELKKLSGNKFYDDIIKLQNINVTEDNLPKAKLFLQTLDENKREISANIQRELGRLDFERQEISNEINEISKTLRILETKSLRYNDTLLMVRKEIEDGLFKIYNKNISVHLLAELLDVSDSKWHNTIEDYLGNQRFNLIVEPRYFDDALRIYNQIKQSRNIFSIGLVNTKKITTFETFQPNSLASIITTENMDARRYINMSVGNVIMCYKPEDLEKYNTSVTIDGLSYSRFTVRSLNKNQEKPFIGKNAYEEQLSLWKNLAIEARDKFEKNKSNYENLNLELLDLENLSFKKLMDNLECNIEVQKIKEGIHVASAKKNSINKDGMSFLEDEYQKIKTEIQGLNDKKVTVYELIGKFKGNISINEESIKSLESQIIALENQLKVFNQRDLSIQTKAESLLNDQISMTKDPQKVYVEYNKLIALELNNISALEDNLKHKQFKYNNDYNSGFGLGSENVEKYLVELDKLVKSELINYENKVREARESAEKLFKEDFLSKLRDYIMTAQNEITQINQALENIRFGEDKYEFIFPRNKEYMGIYEMIVSSSMIDDSIFSYEFQTKYHQELDELFVQLSLDEENSKGAISKFMDYRTYMDYDIKITNKNNQTLTYSKVFKEKSGGETQVPFYVAIIASFVQMYQQCEKNMHGEGINLILFDEVFDKMDSKRIKSMMEFINSLPVQIILATPPQRMEIMASYTDTILITLRDKENAFVYEKKDI